jgi:hypothetical protein
VQAAGKPVQARANSTTDQLQRLLEVAGGPMTGQRGWFLVLLLHTYSIF